MRVVYICALLLLIASTAQSPATARRPAPIPNEALKSRAVADGGRNASARTENAYGRLPLSFERNVGQTDGPYEFLVRGEGYAAYIGPAGTAKLILSAHPVSHIAPDEPVVTTTSRTAPHTRSSPEALEMRFVGATQVLGEARSELRGKVNYLIGADPSTWRTSVPTYGGVAYPNVYPGIDVNYYGRRHTLEYDVVVHPGADPSVIRIAFEGADRLQVTPAGDLMVEIGSHSVIKPAPFVFQELHGTRRHINSRYRIIDRTQVAFEIDAYDEAEMLVIDPIIYATYLGGTFRDYGHAVTVDAQGNAYVAVQTELSHLGNIDIVVTKLDPTGTALIYSTYIGGTKADSVGGIAVDINNNIYLAGYTQSTDFPTTERAFDRTLSGLFDAIAVKLDANGTALVYSTYLGGGAVVESAQEVDIDPFGNAYIVSMVDAAGFPTTPGAFDESWNGGYDVAVTKLNTDGTGLLYSTYIGGPEDDGGMDLEVDSDGNVVIGGWTRSSNFPTTDGAFDRVWNGELDAFVTKLNPSGTALDYSTYIGGTGNDHVNGMALDTSGNVYITGQAEASFPTTLKALARTRRGGGSDGYVTKLASDGMSLVYSTYLGGGALDVGVDIAVDSGGSAYIVGGTRSTDFPTTASAEDRTANGDYDVFISKLNPQGGALSYSSYYGGSDWEDGLSIHLGGDGSVYIAGRTFSGDFPTTSSAFDQTLDGDSDAFVLKLTILGPDFVQTTASAPPSFVSPSAAFSMSDTVMNQGTAPAGSSITKYYLSADEVKSTDDTALIGERYVPELDVNESSSGSAVIVKVPAGTSVGTYTLFACADAFLEVEELYEDNNCLAADSQVTVGYPDLRQTDVRTTYGFASPTSKITVTDTVDNPSALTAAASTTRFYLSLDAVKQADDILLTGKRGVQELSPDEVNTGLAALTLPLSVPDGPYYVLACADDLIKIKEASETNNCAVTPTTLRVGWADLVTTVVSDPPATAIRGQKFSVSDTVANHGTIPTVASVTRYYLSADAVKGAGDVLLMGTRAIGGLDPSGSSSGGRLLTVPSTTPIGAYRVLACADDTSKVPEQDNVNNCRASAATVTIQ
jgi:hypothetical protein